MHLHNSIRKVKKSGKPVLAENIKFNSNGTVKITDIDVIPIKAVNDRHEYFYLILFKDKSAFEFQQIPEQRKKKDSKTYKNNSKDNQIEKLNRELLMTKEHLQSIIEEHEEQMNSFILHWKNCSQAMRSFKA